MSKVKYAIETQAIPHPSKMQTTISINLLRNLLKNKIQNRSNNNRKT